MAGGGSRRLWYRRITYPAEPPATSSSARPARIGRGIGTELALSLVGGAATVPPPSGGSSKAAQCSDPSTCRRPGTDRSSQAERADCAAWPGARARCPPWRSSSRARRAAGSRSRRRSSAAHRCRRHGRCRTSRRSPGGRRTGRRLPSARSRPAVRRTQPARTTARRARRDGWWRMTGVKVSASGGRAARGVRAILQSLSDGVDAGVSGR